MKPKYKWSDSVFYNSDREILNHYKNSQESCLYILGKGFDPRMTIGLQLLSDILDFDETILINFSGKNEYTSVLHEKLLSENMKKLESLSNKYREIVIPENVNLPKFLKDSLEIPIKCNRVIVDISSMPQNIYFNIVKQILRYIKQQKNDQRNIKFDIITCENSALDDVIVPTDLGAANYLFGLDTYSNDLESDVNRMSVWFPLLGKNCRFELDKLQSFLLPKEICPVLPFPSRNPRRSEEIFSELGEALFSHLEIDKKNIIYVSEQNVFDIYNKLHAAIRYYDEVLKEIGDPRFYISTGSSKLIGLGALLVQLELSESEISISFVQVNNNGYDLEISGYNPLHNQICLFCMEDNRYEW